PAALPSFHSFPTRRSSDLSMASYSEGAKLGIPVGLAVKTGGPIVSIAARLYDGTDENVQKILASLPADLDQIDSWIADGVMGGEDRKSTRLNSSHEWISYA